MKKITVLLMLAIVLAGLVLFGLSDTVISTADASVPNNEVTSSRSEANNASATATITITMYTMPNE